MRFSKRKKQHTIPDVVITSLLDINFLLIMFFLMTAHFQQESHALLDLPREVEDPRDRERTLLDELADRLPFEPFHRDERLPFVLAEFVDGTDVWMLEGGGEPGLPLEPVGPFLAELVAERVEVDDPERQNQNREDVDGQNPPGERPAGGPWPRRVAAAIFLRLAISGLFMP